MGSAERATLNGIPTEVQKGKVLDHFNDIIYSTALAHAVQNIKADG